MIAFSWMLFALLALFWTAAAWITAAATEWTVQALASGTVDAAGAWLPLAGTAAGWLVPAIWIAWGLGLLLLLLAAAVVHLLLRRFSGNHAGHRMARAST
ncbi:MAG: hypothetical protein K0S48_1198 [Ramlibacter sp.]|nr:hypothetical protein [Ramlibacter sp.]